MERTAIKDKRITKKKEIKIKIYKKKNKKKKIN